MAEILHEQKMEMKGGKLVPAPGTPQCAGCLREWPCEVKSLQLKIKEMEPLYSAAMVIKESPGARVEISGLLIQACDEFGRPING